MKKKLIIILTISLIVIASILALIIFKNKDDYKAGNEYTIGVWWWNDSLEEELYLNFAKDNGINEIYYCTDDFKENTANFIRNSNEKGINVYWLAGEYQWLEDITNLYAKIEKYEQFQNNYDYNFSGIHLDIEPHQNPNFEENRI